MKWLQRIFRNRNNPVPDRQNLIKLKEELIKLMPVIETIIVLTGGTIFIKDDGSLRNFSPHVKNVVFKTHFKIELVELLETDDLSMEDTWDRLIAMGSHSKLKIALLLSKMLRLKISTLLITMRDVSLLTPYFYNIPKLGKLADKDLEIQLLNFTETYRLFHNDIMRYPE